MTINVLGSSSSGNCYLINCSDQTLILECGVPYKKILEGLHFTLENIAGCLITHSHQDHCKSAFNLAKAGIDLYSSEGTFHEIGISSHRVHPIEPLKQFKVGNFSVLSFPVEHDCLDPRGFLIHHPEVGRLLFITDTFYVRYNFQNLTHIMIECNYSKDILERNVQAGKVPSVLRNRIIKSHLSLENLKSFLSANDLSNVENIMLMHLSSDNSDSKLFKTEIEKHTGKPVQIC